MNYIKCLHCERIVSIEDARPNVKTIKGVGYVCENCIRDSMDFFECYSCGEFAEFGECNSDKGGGTYGDFNGTYCSECATEAYKDYILESEDELVKDFELWLNENSNPVPTTSDLEAFLSTYAYEYDKDLFEANIDLVKEILHKNFKITNDTVKCENQMDIPLF